MIVVFGFLDRFLDIVGLIALIYWSIKLTKWTTAKFRKA